MSIPINNAPLVNEKIVEIAVQAAKKIYSDLKQEKVRILDLGTGEGVNVQKLYDRLFIEKIPHEIVACDIDGNIFQANISTVTFHSIDLDKEYSFGEFDIVIATEVIEHIENPYKFIRDSVRHLKHGGLLLVSSPNAANIYSIVKILFRGIPSMFHRSLHSGHIMPISPYLLEMTLLKINFEKGTHFNSKACYNRNVLLLPFKIGSIRSVKLPGENRIFGEVAIYQVSENLSYYE